MRDSEKLVSAIYDGDEWVGGGPNPRTEEYLRMKAEWEASEASGNAKANLVSRILRYFNRWLPWMSS